MPEHPALRRSPIVISAMMPSPACVRESPMPSGFPHGAATPSDMPGWPSPARLRPVTVAPNVAPSAIISSGIVNTAAVPLTNRVRDAPPADPDIATVYPSGGVPAYRGSSQRTVSVW